MKLKPSALALTAGIIWGGMVMLATWWVLLFNTGGGTIMKLKNFYLGYDVTFLGGVVGLLWGFVEAFIFGYLIALLYNVFSTEKKAGA